MYNIYYLLKLLIQVCWAVSEYLSRVPFQRKIGAGFSLDEFEKKKHSGSMRHVGLTESMHMIANRMGWHLDRTEDILTPVNAKSNIKTDEIKI